MIFLKNPIVILLFIVFFFLLPLHQGTLFAQGTPGGEEKETKTERNSAGTEVKKSPGDFPYTAVAEKNIFSPDRKEFPLITPSATTGEMKKPKTRPQLILYGITITEDYQSATLSNPGGPLRKGERDMVTLKAGEKLGDYRLAKILNDRVMMESGEDSFEILLFDPKSPKKRVSIRTEVKPATVATATPSVTTAPATPPASPSGAPPPERVVPASPSSPAPPTYPLRPGRGRTPISPSQGLPTPASPSEVAPVTPISPTPIPPPTSLPVPMSPRSIPVAPPAPIPITPSGPTPQGSGG